MPRCPACSELLFRRKIESVEVDGCPGCGGAWLDKGELHALAKSPEALRKLDRTFVPGAQAMAPQHRGLCPRCEQPLVQMEFEQFRGVRLDRCKPCGGLWLDHGEAGAIADKLDPPPVAAEPVLETALAPSPPCYSGLELATEISPVAFRAQAVAGIRQPVAAATALVHNFVDRGTAAWPGRFWDALHQADSLDIKQQFEVAELFGFETRNKYAISADARGLGWAAEQGGDALAFIGRQFLGHWRTFEITIFDELPQPVLRAFHPFRFFFQRLEISLADGTFLGAIQQRWSFFHKRFDVTGRDGRLLMTVNSPLWRLWTFPFKRGEEEVAVVQKRWSGLLSEGFTDRDNFTVKLGEKLGDPERALVLASAIFIDLQYFERKANR